jgi:hypothetical protein
MIDRTRETTMIPRADDLTAQPTHFCSTSFFEVIKSNAIGCHSRKSAATHPTQKTSSKFTQRSTIRKVSTDYSAPPLELFLPIPNFPSKTLAPNYP